mmetsp:Transcript_32108/g.36509  ORF Transcript_32108/g.36509 Transcript_32108/m.36509 type:complete len:231 (-) Transcript_32108:310-1002(-)
MANLLHVLLFYVLGTNSAFSLQPSAKTLTKAPAASAASSRRQWLASTAGIATIVATTSVSVVNAEPSLISKVQGPVQDLIQPGHWIGQFVGINSKQETWNFPRNTPEEVSKAIVNVLEGLTPERKDKLIIPEFEIQTADATKVHVLTWTKLEWLDTFDVRLFSSSSGCTAKASFYATGFFPTIVPGAPLLNVGMAWFPFASPGPRGEMLQDFRLRALKGLVTKQLEATNI